MNLVFPPFNFKIHEKICLLLYPNLFHLSTVKGTSCLNPTSQPLNISSNLLVELTCFTWNQDHCSFLGSSIFTFCDGNAEYFPCGLPVKGHDYTGVLFYFLLFFSLFACFNLSIFFCRPTCTTTSYSLPFSMK